MKVEVRDETVARAKSMWLLVNDSDDECPYVFANVDNELNVHTNMRFGIESAVSYDNLQHQRTAAAFTLWSARGRATTV